MIRARRLSPILALPLLLIAACGPAGADPTESDPPATDIGFDLAGIWRDTDVVGANSCDLPQPEPGASRVTEGIVITQEGDLITLTSPVNQMGTQTVASGTLSSDGAMVLTGSDGEASVTLTYQAVSDSEITGTSQVDTGTCTFDFTNSLVKTAEPE